MKDFICPSGASCFFTLFNLQGTRRIAASLFMLPQQFRFVKHFFRFFQIFFALSFAAHCRSNCVSLPRHFRFVKHFSKLFEQFLAPTRFQPFKSCAFFTGHFRGELEHINTLPLVCQHLFSSLLKKFVRNNVLP